MELNGGMLTYNRKSVMERIIDNVLTVTCFTYEPMTITNSEASLVTLSFINVSAQMQIIQFS